MTARLHQRGHRSAAALLAFAAAGCASSPPAPAAQAAPQDPGVQPPAQHPPPAQQPALRDLDAGPYRTPRAGEGIRTVVFGREVEVEPRDRRCVAAWDVGVATTPRLDDTPVLPFGSLYFWHHPDDDELLRATVVGVFNDVFYARSPEGWGAREWVATFESFTVPAQSSAFIDGEVLDFTKLYWGYVRPGIGGGWRERIGPANDNMAAVDLIVEPGLLYFARGSDTPDGVEIPDTTLELRARLQARLDLIERNLLELPHEGVACGADLVYGYRANWDDWGAPGTGYSFAADDSRDYLLLTAYAVGVTQLPFVGSERHRLIGSVHGGAGDGVDRFSAVPVGGGPDPRAEEYGAIARPVLPGAAINEFYPEHYAIGYAGYRWEPLFFVYLDVGGALSILDRYRLQPGGTVDRETDTLAALGARLTSGFAFETRLQMSFAHNFDVIRDGDEGGFEFTVHISRSF